MQETQEIGFAPWVRKIPWRRAWQPTPVFLPGESHGQRSLAGCNPLGRKDLDTTEATELAYKPSELDMTEVTQHTLRHFTEYKVVFWSLNYTISMKGLCFVALCVFFVSFIPSFENLMTTTNQGWKDCLYPFVHLSRFHTISSVNSTR